MVGPHQCLLLLWVVLVINADDGKRDDRNIFLEKAVAGVKTFESLALFTGHSVKKIFDTEALSPVHFRCPHVRLNGRTRSHVWSHIATLANQTFHECTATPPVQRAVRVHNEHKIGDLLQHIVIQGRRARRQEGSKDKKRVLTDVEFKHTMQPNISVGKGEMQSWYPPLVITNTVDENWGFLSTGINTRTTMWINMTNHLRIHDITYSNIHTFLNDSQIALMIVNTHIDPRIGYHDKVISIPLGIRDKKRIFQKAESFLMSNSTNIKKRMLQINNSGWGDRAVINELISAAFNHSVKNSYIGAFTTKDENRGHGGPIDREKQRRERKAQKKKQKMINKIMEGREQNATSNTMSSSTEATSAADLLPERIEGKQKRKRKKRGGGGGVRSINRRLLEKEILSNGARNIHTMNNKRRRALFDHLAETTTSRFSICPSGLGMDTYRLWETLMLGSIPIVESNAGFDRTYASLPVLIVRNYTDVNAALLERAYPCFVKHAKANHFKYEHLTQDYWIQLIQTALDTGNVEHIRREHPPRHKYCDFLV